MPDSLSEAQKEAYMRRALELARQAWGRTHPNPMVGAVLVEGGKIVSEGFHAAAGLTHAERAALVNLGRKPAAGAVLFITMEPCCTTGRTPPCTEIILSSGVRHVVCGATDPNPRHAGRGYEILRRAGVTVQTGVLEAECEDLNLLFNHQMKRGRPLFAAKMAMTLDGRMASRTGASRWITGEAARADVMRWRRLFPAIAVGVGTLLADNPSLTSRLTDEAWCPRRFIWDRHLRSVQTGELPEVYSDRHAAQTVVVCGMEAQARAEATLQERGVGVWRLEAPLWPAFRRRCAEEGLMGVLFEGGPTLLRAAFLAQEMDYLFAYIAPRVAGDEEGLSAFGGRVAPRLEDWWTLRQVRHASLGNDLLLRGSLEYTREGGVA